MESRWSFYLKCSPNTMMSRALIRRRCIRNDEYENTMNTHIDVFEKKTLPQRMIFFNVFDAETSKAQVLDQIKSCYDASGRLIV